MRRAPTRRDARAVRGLTLLVVTHDAAVAARADRVVQMLDGRNAGEDVPYLDQRRLA